MARLSQGVAGNAGVLFVAAELSRRGLIALPTVRNTEGVDLIVSEPKGGKSVALQVKTSQSPLRKWLLTAKCEQEKAPRLFYVFVNLGLPGELPQYHIVPSRVVATTVKKEHKQWRETPGRHGQAHADTPMRVFYDLAGNYLDNWKALGLSMIE